LAARSPAETFFLWTERSAESTKTRKRLYIKAIYELSLEVGTIVGAAFNQAANQQVGIIGRQEMP